MEDPIQELKWSPMVNKQQFLHKIMELNPSLNHTLINWAEFWL